MRFAPEFIDKVRDANNIVDIIGQFVKLTRAGSSYRGLCPFPDHHEKTPSFYVSDVKQLYHCFGCKKSGAVYNFLIDYQGMTFLEAVEYLAGRANITLPALEKIPGTTVVNDSTGDQKKLLYKVNKYVGALYQSNLSKAPESHVVKRYLKQREISDPILKEFKIGYSTSGWSDLGDALKRSGAPLEAAEKLGLIKKKQNGGTFDLFRDRLMFPIISANGNVVGFGGRVLDSSQPKYLNSPESPVFSKGRTLYGLHVTAKYIRAQNEAFVVEGYMDLLALYQAGIQNVVATLGTALTHDHASALQRLCSRVVAVFDGDDAGQAAANKSLPVFLEVGLFSKHLILPDKLDPDDFLKKYGPGEFKRLTLEAPDHLLSFMNRQITHFRGQPSEQVEVLNIIGPLLERVRDQRLSSLYLQELADRLDLDPKWVKQQLSMKRSQPIGITQKSPFSSAAAKIPTEESVLVQFMLEKQEYLKVIMNGGVIEMFANDEAREIANKIIEKYCQNPNDFDKLGALLIGQGISHELLTSQIAFRANEGDLDETGERQLIQDCLVRVKDRHLKGQSRKILNSLRTESDSNTENLEIFMKIAKETKGPKNP